MNKPYILGVFIVIFAFSLRGLSQYKSYHGLSLHSPNISNKGEIYASVNLPIEYSEITVAYAPFNNLVIQTSTNFGSVLYGSSRFNQTAGLGLVKRVKNDCVLGFRSFVGYHKYYFQNFETDIHDLPTVSAPLTSTSRIAYFCYYQYNSASIQGDITLDIGNAQLYMCSSLMRLNYSYLRMYNEFKNYGVEERYNFYETHHTLDVGLRYALVKNFYATANAGLRSLIRSSSPSKSPLKSQTLDLYYLNIGVALKFDARKTQENKKGE